MSKQTMGDQLLLTTLFQQLLGTTHVWYAWRAWHGIYITQFISYLDAPSWR